MQAIQNNVKMSFIIYRLDKMDENNIQVRWKDHQRGVMDYLGQLLDSEMYVDVTLSCQNKRFKAHRVVLSTCSSYLRVSNLQSRYQCTSIALYCPFKPRCHRAILAAGTALGPVFGEIHSVYMQPLDRSPVLRA